ISVPLVKGQRRPIVDRRLKENGTAPFPTQSFLGREQQLRSQPSTPSFLQNINRNDVPCTSPTRFRHDEPGRCGRRPSLPIRFAPQRERTEPPHVGQQLQLRIGNPPRKAHLIDLPEGVEVPSPKLADFELAAHALLR